MLKPFYLSAVAAVAFAAACQPSTPAQSADSAEPSASAEASPTKEEAAASEQPAAAGDYAEGSIYPLTMQRLDGTTSSLSEWAGMPLLIVNTASKCGHTPQYEGLEALYEEYKDRGFAVLGFPSNDFGGQEPGTAEEIQTFCRLTYGVQFPMFAKVSVKGPDQAELFARLSESLGEPQWNFHKYLIDKRGRPVKAFPSAVQPRDPELISAIEAELAK